MRASEMVRLTVRYALMLEAHGYLFGQYGQNSQVWLVYLMVNIHTTRHPSDKNVR
jgi:phage-related holin